MRIVKVIVALSLLLPTITSANSLLVKVPGTAISMNSPEGFTLSESFSGFESLDTSSSILIAELPKEAYPQLKTLFSNLKIAKQGFAAKGVNISKLQTVEVGDTTIPLLSGVQEVQGIVVNKYVALVYGDSTALVTYNILNEEEFSSNNVVESLSSIVIGAEVKASEKAKSLLFKFKEVPPFQLADVMAGSSAILTTFDRVDPTGERPIVVIGNSLSSSSINDIELFSEQLLRSVSGFKSSTVINSSPVKFAGLDGYKVLATYDDKTIIQYVGIKSDGQYIRLISTGSSKAVNELKGAIESIAESITFVR